MWAIVETADAKKTIDKLQPQVAQRDDAWQAIVRLSGPEGLRKIKSFHDEKLKGNLSAFRSSRLGGKWRLIYRIDGETGTVVVKDINAHVYR